MKAVICGFASREEGPSGLRVGAWFPSKPFEAKFRPIVIAVDDGVSPSPSRIPVMPSRPFDVKVGVSLAMLDRCAGEDGEPGRIPAVVDILS